MTIKQRFLKLVYPVFMLLQKKGGQSKIQSNPAAMPESPVPFYSLEATTNAGKPFSFSDLKGRYVLIVNTASECGYTPQYTGLEALHQQYRDKIAVIGFPANNFGGQEPGGDDNIASFCQVNFGVTFPLMQKADVVGAQKQPVYQWLTKPEQNGWNSQRPEWNFSKYLISPQGQLLHYFPPAVDPMDEAITKYLS
jgi:glutathione peroxidase